MHRGKELRMKAVFSSEIMQAKRQWSNIFTELKEKIYLLRILYSAKMYFKNEGKIPFEINEAKRIDYQQT